MLQTPVLFIIFNRPEITRRTFSAIRKAKPKKLFVMADGPRAEYPEDVAKCEAARKAASEVDWDCELHTLFRHENRGCGHGPAEAITWFFNQVEQGIILEDDCYLANEGFYFYQEVLKKYKNDTSVGLITACNLMGKWKAERLSYVKAGPITPTLGCWASWKRSWTNFDYYLTEFDSESSRKKINDNITHKTAKRYWTDIFKSLRSEPRSDVWDYQFHFTRSVHTPITIVSSVNMVSNIGFTPEATHTKNSNTLDSLPIFQCTFPIRHHNKKRDYLFEWIVFERFYNPKKRSLVKKIIMKAIKIIYT